MGKTNVFFEMHFGDYKTTGFVGPFSFSVKGTYYNLHLPLHVLIRRKFKILAVTLYACLVYDQQPGEGQMYDIKELSSFVPDIS